MSFFKGVAAELKRLKWLSASSDALNGYKNAKITIQAPAMLVSAELKVSSGIYFIPISFVVSETTGSANG